MNRLLKRRFFPIAVAAVAGLLAGLLVTQAGGRFLDLLAAFGEWMYMTSYRTEGGNLLVWAIMTVIVALPAFGLLWKGKSRANWLLLLASFELVFVIYYLINPVILISDNAWFALSLGTGQIARMWGMISLSCVAGTMIAWFMLRLLEKMEVIPARLLPRVLTWAALLYAAFAGFSAMNNLLNDMTAVAEANSDASRVLSSSVVLAVVAMLELIPQIFSAVVILWGADLAAALDGAPFEEGTMALAESIAHRCGLVARVSLLVSVAGNLLQLLLFSVAASVTIHIQLPILTLALCAVLLLLCKYFRRAKAVNDDNATII